MASPTGLGHSFYSQFKSTLPSMLHNYLASNQFLLLDSPLDPFRHVYTSMAPCALQKDLTLSHWTMNESS